MKCEYCGDEMVFESNYGIGLFDSKGEFLGLKKIIGKVYVCPNYSDCCSKIIVEYREDEKKQFINLIAKHKEVQK